MGAGEGRGAAFLCGAGPSRAGNTFAEVWRCRKERPILCGRERSTSQFALRRRGPGAPRRARGSGAPRPPRRQGRCARGHCRSARAAAERRAPRRRTGARRAPAGAHRRAGRPATAARAHPHRRGLADYALALDGLERAVSLGVHRSNLALVGFTEMPAVADLAKLARERGALLIHDLGSGALDPALDEYTAAQSLREGADIVLISGDKLLGGPQAGIVLGRREPVEKCRRHPLSRALRADRMLLAALEATLRLYPDGRAAH